MILVSRIKLEPTLLMSDQIHSYSIFQIIEMAPEIDCWLQSKWTVEWSLFVLVIHSQSSDNYIFSFFFLLSLSINVFRHFYIIKHIVFLILENKFV